MARKAFLIVFFLVAPPLLTIAFYVASKYLLAATNRTISELTLDFLAIGEIAFFYLGAFLEVRSLWSAPISD